MDKNQHIDKLFKSAREQNIVHSFDDTKASFLNSLNSGSSSVGKGKNGFSTFKNLIIMLTTVSTILVSALLLFNSNDNKNPNKTEISELKIQQTKESIAQLDNSKEITVNNQIQKTNNIKTNEVLSPVIPEINFSDLFHTPSPIVESIFKKAEKQNLPKEDPYVFPKLTEQEIKENNKHKKEMLKYLEKFDRKKYVNLVSGTFDYNGKIISVQSFLIQKTEVSNLEYRTFLFDLLIQGKKAEFLKAKPDQQKWNNPEKNQYLNQYAEHYFSHPAYDNYPVVNISREGAEMYCIWLTQELFKIIDDKKKGNFNDIRLPSREEWVMAASIEGKAGPYPWEGSNTRNSEGMIMANYWREPEDSYDSLKMSAAFDLTSPVESYWPNDFGLYCMSGNVAEMVYNDIELKTAGTAGGGWMNSAEEIKILGPDPYSNVVKPHPCIGFRVVMTVLNK